MADVLLEVRNLCTYFEIATGKMLKSDLILEHDVLRIGLSTQLRTNRYLGQRGPADGPAAAPAPTGAARRRRSSPWLRRP